MINKSHLFPLLVVIPFLFSCTENNHKTLSDKIETNTIPYQGILNSTSLLKKDSLVQITEGNYTFLIPKRKEQITSFSCVECHTKPVEQMKNKKIKKAHWDIKFKHAKSTIMNCTTCHNGKNMDVLTSLTGDKIDFNYSYQLCAQCHSTQFEDWKGGAHGKKIAGWAPPRASLTCVNCHNPHQPSYKKRWPAQFNTKKIRELQEGIAH